MNQELTKEEIKLILEALNAIAVRGKESMIAVLKLMVKLEETIKSVPRTNVGGSDE